MKFVLLDSSKNSVHDGIKCGLSFVKFVKQITNLSRARYSANFDTKHSSIVFFFGSKKTTNVVNRIIHNKTRKNVY
ncbi:hypothetical protein T01_14189 [Trichinella spiralis]|uniref:Uncharacterized protein n=1 Tax=Trichinella spiralis TaxID=6334 RepID=A0A0V1ANP3_TRISP|nr:hypothetical protein T01_14623 [Trichinella spiralis]KRY42102.1 hypothetical protein T01_14189 [Trichinella spiralis]